MKAKITQNHIENGYNHSGKKEEITHMVLTAVYKGEVVELATVRCWMGRSRNASMVYCSIWVNDRKTQTYVSGHGTAGGWGYHKASAALQEALKSAGIELYGSPYEDGAAYTEWDYETKTSRTVKVDHKKRAYINGCGDSSMVYALNAIGRALGYRKLKVIGG